MTAKKKMMRIELLRCGVPDSIITLDGEGFRTINSVVRAKVTHVGYVDSEIVLYYGAVYEKGLKEYNEALMTFNDEIEQAQNDLNKAEEESASLPSENDYQALAKWLVAEKTLGNDYYGNAGYNRSKMCRELRKILGWEPDQNSLRKAQNK